MIPPYIDPMLAQLANEPFDNEAYQFEIKWDGTRALAFCEAEFRLQNRRQSHIQHRFPELDVLCKIPHGCVLDGEIVVIEAGKSNFEKLQQRDSLEDPLRIEILSEKLTATYVAFDLLYWQNQDLSQHPLYQRQEILHEVINQLNSSLVLMCEHIDKQGKAMFQAIEAQGMEGIMAKKRNSLYEYGKRSSAWKKIKVAQHGIFHVVGYTHRDGHVSALVIGDRETDHYYGKVGTGYSEQQRIDLLCEFQAYMPGSPLSDGPKEVEWVNCERKAKVKYMEQTSSGKLRSPVFMGFI